MPQLTQRILHDAYSPCFARPSCQNSSSCFLSASADASMPAKIAQNAELTPRMANGVAATMNATSAPNRIFPPNAFSSASWSDARIATPARASTYDLGSTFSSEATGVDANASTIVSAAEITAAQYRPDTGPASGPAAMAAPVLATVAA